MRALAADALLGVEAVELDVAELGVRHETAVDEQPGADAGAEREDDHDAAATAPGAERHLRHTRRIGVVDDGDVTTGGLREERVDVGADPRLVDVRGAVHHAVADHRWHRRPDVPVQLKWSTSSLTTRAIASGVAGCGVSMR